MKKIIILILSLFLCTGCLDYHEINDIALVKAIGIDYQNDEYYIILEVLNDNKKDNISSYTITGHDTSLAEAILNASSKLNKEANFSHTEVMLLSKNIIETKFQNIIDYFLRSTKFRENLYVLSSLNTPLEDILNYKNDANLIATNAILGKMKNNNETNNPSIIKDFERILKEIVTYGKDTCFTNITLNDDDLIIDGAVAFHDYKYMEKLSNEEVLIYNLLLNNNNNYILNNTYDNKEISLSVNNGKPSVKIINNRIEINGSFTGTLVNNAPNFDIRLLETIDIINEDFKNILDNNIFNFINHLQSINSDILGIDNLFYKKNRYKLEGYWQKLEVNVDTKFNINKKGIIYEVDNEK